MSRSILVRGARQLVTLHGRSGPRRGDQMQDLAVIEDGSILVVDGQIRRVGPTRQIENVAEAKKAEEINATGCVVMSAFIDCHTWLVAAPPRVTFSREGIGDLAGRPGTPEWRRGLQWVRGTPASSLQHTASRYLEMALRHGTATLEAKSGFALNSSGELKILRVMSAIGNTILSLVPTYCGAYAKNSDTASVGEYLDSVAIPLIQKLRERKLARYVEALCDPAGFSPQELRPYFTEAARHGFPIKIQGDETGHAGSVALALEFSAVAASGLNRISREEAETLASSSTIAVLLPARATAGDAGCPPGRALLDAGGVVALASGFHPSATSTLNMQAVIALACQRMHFTVEEAVSAATVNAAYAVGSGMICGTLEADRRADLLILNIPDYREVALHFGCNVVRQVMRHGEIVAREASLTCARS